MKKIKDYILDKDLILKLMFILIIINPILDFYWLFLPKVIDVLHFSPSTIIRTIMVALIALMFLLTIKKGKLTKWYFVYFGLIVAYALAHHFNAIDFTAFYPERLNYSTINELFYVIRMSMPMCLIIVLSNYKVSDDKTNKVLAITTLIVCATIVFTNLFKISKASYTDEFIYDNVICWLKSGHCGLSFRQLASRGLFQSANSISALLLMLLPINIYYFIKKSNLVNSLTILFSLLAMYLLGTKVGTYGFLLACIISVIIYLVFVIIYKSIKFKGYTFFYLLGLIGLFVLILPYSTMYMRMQVDKDLKDDRAYLEEINRQALEEMDNNIKSFVKENYPDKYNENYTYIDNMNIMSFNEKADLLVPFLLENYNNFSINDEFIVFHYPYWVDPEMWYKVFHEDYMNRVNNRFLETTFLKRVKEVNNKKSDEFLGITYVRQGKIFTLERDFVSHYYTLGYIGVLLLLMPYVFVIIASAAHELMHIKKVNPKVVYFLLGIGLCVCAGFYSGNVLDSLMVSLILAYLCAVVLNESFGGKYGE